MQKEDSHKVSLTELKKKEKSAQLLTSLLIGIIIVQVVVGIFLTVADGFSIFTFMPAVFIPVAVISYSNLKKIKNEIAKRNAPNQSL